MFVTQKVKVNKTILPCFRTKSIEETKYAKYDVLKGGMENFKFNIAFFVFLVAGGKDLSS